MADGIKNKIEEAGHKVAEGAKQAGSWVKDKATEAADWAKEKTGMGNKDATGACGTAKSTADIKPHMQVISSCGCRMGTVDHMDGGAIKLTKNDSPDGQHHFIPVGWVARVDEHVHLSKNADETRQGGKSDATGCGRCGA